MPKTPPREFTYRNHWLGQRHDSPYWYIFWREPPGRRVFRRSTKTTNMELAKELLISFAGAELPPTAKGREWLRIQDALDAYTRHMRERPSFPMVETTCHHILEFCRASDIVYIGQFTIDQQDAYIALRRRQITAHHATVSNATLNRELGIVRTAFQHAFNCGRISHVPHVQHLPDPPARQRVLNLEETHRLLAASKVQPHLHLFVQLALFTLQRRRAILSLRCEQVDLRAGLIDFRPPGVPLTSKRAAIVPICKTLWPAVAQAIQSSKSGYVVERNGIQVGDAKRSLATAARNAGITGPVTSNVLRRTAATLLAGAGVPMRQISGMLGHTQIRTTERYTQHDPAYLAEARDALDRLLRW